jgi:hypothetical protein
MACSVCCCKGKAGHAGLDQAWLLLLYVAAGHCIRGLDVYGP